PGRAAGILLLGDGQPRLDAHRAIDAAQLVRFGSCVRLLRARRWRLFTVGVGPAARPGSAANLMRVIAESAGRRYLPAPGPDDLRDIYASHIAELRLSEC